MDENKITDIYVVATEDWPLRYVAVIRTSGGDMQKSTFTYWGARHWQKKWAKRFREWEKSI